MRRLLSLIVAVTLILIASAGLCFAEFSSDRIMYISIGYDARYSDISFNSIDPFIPHLGPQMMLNVFFKKSVPDGEGGFREFTADDLKMVQMKNKDSGLTLKRKKGYFICGEDSIFKNWYSVGASWYYAGPSSELIGEWKILVKYNDGAPDEKHTMEVTPEDLRLRVPGFSNVRIGVDNPFNPGSLVVSCNASVGVPRQLSLDPAAQNKDYVLRIWNEALDDLVFQINIGDSGCGYQSETNTIYFTIPSGWSGRVARIEMRIWDGEVSVGASYFARSLYYFIIPE